MKRTGVIHLGVTLFLSSCIGAGTHGSIHCYEYPVTKYELQDAVEKVIKESTNILRDTTRNYMVDVTDGKSDTIYSNYYNDGKSYLTINIEQEKGYNNYIFRYSGDSAYWASSETSGIFIAYAFDENHRGGSEGNGGITWYKPFLKQKLVTVFKRELIEKLNVELGVEPVETD
ncbi:MAG: hypothetical protein EOP48_11290 [Sphingobacteriales bacterium]|nr:MAG: hypothetical protein EOP48_11290 [Sphingobacteriales bacterium]